MSHSAEPVTILVVRSGGFAGLRRAWRVLADGADTAGWIALVEACPWHEPASRAPGAETGADRFAWEVTAARGAAGRQTSDRPEAAPDRPEEHRALLAEADVAGPWRELIDAVRDRGEPCSADVP
ncbi:protealysin inhibitor emfourin [Microbacterium sp. 179-B 1A2 NHS]|uniref:protealysin inhibitor emfourin n=1 Tax=Microbacterium sp. 179-B 1A2 NHS TaxID=3142383 RepID=UPI0039A15A43